MSEKSAKPFLEHILASVGIVGEYVKGKTFEDFSGDVELQDAGHADTPLFRGKPEGGVGYGEGEYSAIERKDRENP